MITAIAIFVLAALYSFKEYYDSGLKKDLWFGIILFASAAWTLWQTIKDNEQANTIEKQTATTQRLAELDSTLSIQLDSLVRIDTGLSRKSNDIANQSLAVSNQNQQLITHVKGLSEQSKRLINAVNKRSAYEATENLETAELKMNFSKSFKDEDMVTVVIGNNTITTYISWIKQGGSFVNMGGKDLFNAHFINNKIFISLNVYDLYGNLIAEIVDNNWRPNKNFTGKFNYDDTSFEVINNQGEVAINVDFLSNNKIIVNGIFPFRKDNLIILAGKKSSTLSFNDTYDYYIQALEIADIKKIFVYTGKDWLKKRVKQ